MARIKDKLLHAQNRLGLFMEWHTSAGEQIKDRLASYKAIQEAAEAIADVAALLVKGLGIAPHDDYSNYCALKDKGALSDRSLSVLNEFNGLRNALVHDYEDISDSRALEAAQRLVPEILEVIGEVDEWISTQH